jgi:hypothetical protein
MPPLGSNLPHHVLEELSDDPSAQMACIAALMDVQHGEGKLSAADYSGAIKDFLKAQAVFAGIPRAKALLGNVKNKIAGSYGNQGKWEKCGEYAEDALAIAADVPRLEYEEACARMTLGSALWSLGNPQKGKLEYDKARALFLNIPGSEAELAAIEQNQRSFSIRQNSSDRSEAPRHRGALSLMTLLAIVVAMIYVFVRGCQ